MTLGFVGTDRLARDVRAVDVRRERVDMCEDVIPTRVCARSWWLFGAARARVDGVVMVDDGDGRDGRGGLEVWGENE